MIGIDVGLAPLFEGNVPSTCKRSAMKIIRKNNNKKVVTHLEWCTRQSCLVLTYLLQGLASPILTMVLSQYFSICFSLAFLKGYCPSLSLEVTSLHLDLMIWNLSVLSNRIVSSTIISSQSCWMYSNFFLFFFSSTILHLSASFFALAFASLLAF